MPPVYFELPFGIVLDVSFWQWWLNSLTVSQQINVVYTIGGWTILGLIFFFMGLEFWEMYRQSKYTAKWEWVLLAIDIPPIFIQTHKAVEQIFAQLSGAQIGLNIGQKFWQGKKQKWFSFEIISIEGYIQFLIRTEVEFRDLVESAVYAQYPEAEITEVEDYTGFIPKTFPNATHNLFGVEFGLAESYAYPIRTYPEFEYTISKDVIMSDPMASILENFSRIGKGENLWLQFVIEPTGNKWKSKGIDLVKAIIANKKESHFSILGLIGVVPNLLVKELSNVWNWNFEPGEAAHGEEAPAGKISDMTPGGKATIEAIEEKISKIGFKTKIRSLYLANKEVFNPSRCIDGLIGSFNQFHTLNRNAVVPIGVTDAHYALKQWRIEELKRKYFTAYKKRKIKIGGNPYILNIEELTTLWHFPLPFVKTPLVQRTNAKRGEPPMNLPIEIMNTPLVKKRPQPPVEKILPLEQPAEKKAAPPPDLPYA